MYAQQRRTNSRSKASRHALALALLASAGAAQAHQFCVSTAAQLQNALKQSGIGGAYNNESNIVRVVRGTYLTGAATNNGPFYYYSSAGGHLDLYGGYDSTCTSTNWHAAQTVLDGNHHTQVLSLYGLHGEIDVAGFTIQNGESDQWGAGVAMTSGGSAVLIGNIIRNNHSSASGGALDMNTLLGGNLLYLANNVIVGNASDQGLGVGRAYAQGIETLVYNNTIADNTTASAQEMGGLFLLGPTPAYVINNIFWGNTFAGMHIDSSSLTYDYNDSGYTIFNVIPDESIGNLSVQPKFVNRNAGNYHLAPSSPLIGISPYHFTETDPDGNPGSASGLEDLGAYH